MVNTTYNDSFFDITDTQLVYTSTNIEYVIDTTWFIWCDALKVMKEGWKKCKIYFLKKVVITRQYVIRIIRRKRNSFKIGYKCFFKI